MDLARFLPFALGAAAVSLYEVSALRTDATPAERTVLLRAAIWHLDDTLATIAPAEVDDPGVAPYTVYMRPLHEAHAAFLTGLGGHPTTPQDRVISLICRSCLESERDLLVQARDMLAILLEC
jgi:hypothetical protein